MAQINFKINQSINDFIDLMAKEEKMSRASISKMIFMDGLNTHLLPYLANLYKSNKISIKEISKITGLQHTIVISKIASLIDDIDSNPETDEYTDQIRNNFSEYLRSISKQQEISFKDTIN